MSIYPPTFLVESDNFSDAWYRMLRNILNQGKHIIHNSESANPVMTKDGHCIFVLTGEAIDQILNLEIHPDFPTKGQHLNAYLRQFTDDGLEEWKNQPEDKRFEYLYIDRLRDQLNRMYVKVRAAGINRQTQIITWDAENDMHSGDPPCLQRIWIRVFDPDSECPSVEVHVSWRSRDLYGAWMSNMVGVIYMLTKYVLLDKFKIVKITDTSDSLHVYDGDISNALAVKRPVVRL